ncbi:hypothetical protein H7K45_05205 [Mycobacterium yunnanensis]|uniref:Uncharacterized protein n=1 Tax=Mycobacterium yunnanensis TaxID=368477 RepID=A0A9X3C297_9MYCO|nr:hypothetical protein [Mycobacterium yunnanensis]MCV7419932.1 hypothetical protein [Mycobacterium yunnanensis]
MALAIDTDNAAFDGHVGAEVARIARAVADEAESGVVEGICRDCNGMKVGVWKIRLEAR